MARIYQTQNAGTTYQGSAQSSGYVAREGVDDTRKLRDYKNEIIERGKAAERDLTRRQAATNKVLTASQQLAMNQLKMEGRIEEYELKRQQAAEKGIFDINAKIEDYQLDNDNQYIKDTFSIESKYAENELKLRHNHQQRDARNKILGLETQSKITAANTTVFGKAVDGLLRMSSTYIQETEKIRELERKDALQQALVDSMFGLENEELEPIDTNVEAADTVATEDAIQESTDDPQIQNQLRNEASQTTLEQQIRRSTVIEAAQDFPIFFQNWVNDTSVTYTRPDGTTFTVATVESMSDLQQISKAARKAFYASAVPPDADKRDIIQSLVPVVRGVDNAWLTTTSSAVVAGQHATRLQSATVSMQESLDAGKPIQEIWENTFADFYASGAYSGNKAKATEDALKSILSWAVRNKRTDIIDDLASIQKIKGQKGTELGTQYQALFEDSKEKALEEEIGDIDRDRRFSQARVQELDRSRQLDLADAETPLQERQINLDYADQLDELGTTESRRQAAELRSNPNYSPFTIMEMEEEARNGRIWTNEELSPLVQNGDITGKEAQSLGWDPKGGQSQGEQVSDRAREFEAEMKAQGKAAALAALTEDETLSTEDKRLLMESKGVSLIASMERVLMAETVQFIRDNPTASDREISDFISKRGKEIAESSTGYKPGPLIGDTGLRGPGTFINTIGQRVPINEVFPTRFAPGSTRSNNMANDFRGYKPQQLQTRQDVAITGDLILSERELEIASLSIQSGRPIPDSIEEKARALGTNSETLLRSQYRVNGMDYPAPPSNDYLTPNTSSSSSPQSMQRYDTGLIIGGIELDRFRNNLISKESTNNWSAVNRDSGALGAAQVHPDNIADWSRDALGYTISKREFLRSPDLQMKIVNHRLQKYFRQEQAKGYSGDMLIRRVASLWYSGDANLFDGRRSEGNYPSIRDYTLNMLSRYRSPSADSSRQRVYRTANIGPTSTGPHLDVKQVGGGRFDLSELDNYVQVDDPEYGPVTLSEIRRRTNNVGDSWDEHAARGSHGIDVGTASDSAVFIRNGARLISSTPTEHGDLTVIELPNGKRYSFLHGSAA